MIIRRTVAARNSSQNFLAKFNSGTCAVAKSRFRLWGPTLVETGGSILKKRNFIEYSTGISVESPINTHIDALFLSWSHDPSVERPRADHFIVSAFEAGRGVEPYGFTDQSIPVAVSRPQIERDLASLLSPQSVSSYAVVVGESQCGKSTSIRKVIRAMSGPKGVVYCTVPADSSHFSAHLGDLLGFKMYGPACIRSLALGKSPSRGSRQASEPDPRAMWTAMRAPLLEAAKEYLEKHGRAMVLVIDATDRLVREQRDLLARLQDCAKTCAQRGLMRFVFVSSDGAARSFLQSRSAWTGHGELFEVGHLSSQQAEHLLMQRGVPRQAAATAVRHVTGGHFPTLESFLRMYNPKDSDVHAIVNEMDQKVAETMRRLNLLVHSEVFKAMASHPSRRAHRLENYLSESLLASLLVHNIISVHPRGFYTFSSRHVATFFERQLTNMRKETTSLVNFLVACY